MTKTSKGFRKGLQNGAISLAVILAGLLSIGAFFSTTIGNLFHHSTTAAPVVTTQAYVPDPDLSALQSTTAPSTTTIAPAPITTQSDCGSDIQCFITAATTCSPATVSFTNKINFFPYITFTNNSHLQIAGPVTGGQCGFINTTVSQNFAYNAAGASTAQAQGLTQANITAQIKELNDTANKGNVGTIMKCFVPNAKLSAILTNWSKGTVNSTDFSAYACTTTTPAGTTTKPATN